jgi:hypothetical protein
MNDTPVALGRVALALVGAWASPRRGRGMKPRGRRRHFWRHSTPILAAWDQIEIYI